MDVLLNLARKHSALSILYLANLLLSFHFFFVIYINSSYLETFVPTAFVGWVYTIAAVFNVIILLNISRLLRVFGNYRLVTSFIILEIIAITGLILNDAAAYIIPFFVIHQITAPLILFSLDLFLEAATTDENSTGTIRSSYLTLSNISLVISAALVGWIVSRGGYIQVYSISLFFLIPLLLIALRKFRSYKDPSIIERNLIEKIKIFVKDRDLRNIWNARSLLSFFYAWMVVYMPIYLHTNIGFEWSQIGIMFTIMLLPFVLFEIPVGHLADSRFGEKEMMIIGFAIITLAVLVIPTISTASFAIWTSVLFTSRIGASFVEITTESYFFKHVDNSNADAISLYRLTRSLGYITAPIVASISLLFFTQVGGRLGHTFYILAIIVATGIYYSYQLKDTR